MSARLHLLPFLFALLFWASFHPLNLGFLGWFALAPLIVYAREARGLRPFFVAWAAGALAFGAGFFWVRYTVPAGPVLLGIYNGLFVALFVVLVRRLGVLWAPAAWVALEFARGTLFGGLPWFLLGYAQHEALRLVQIADLGGVWLVSALEAFVNAAWVDGRRPARWAAAAALVASLVYGAVRVETIELREGPRIAVVQPNIPQDLKLTMQVSEARKREIYDKHAALTMRAAEERPDLVVWPEAALYEGLLWDARRGEWMKNAWYYRLTETADRARAPLIVGLLVADLSPEGPPAFTNSAVLVGPDRKVRERYDKVHLVPFAEFVPLAERFPCIRDLVHRFSGLRLTDMRAGEGFPAWGEGGGRFGVQICFEAIFPEISRAIARNGAAFTVNISNDGWFRDSAELDQILAMARFRAVENRLGFVRATNTGISAFIEPTGRLSAVLEGKEVEGTLVSRVRRAEAGSLWRAWGSWVGWLALGAAAGALGTRIFVDRKSKVA